jgi:hypothetical protein
MGDRVLTVLNQIKCSDPAASQPLFPQQHLSEGAPWLMDIWDSHSSVLRSLPSLALQPLSPHSDSVEAAPL